MIKILYWLLILVSFCLAFLLTGYLVDLTKIVGVSQDKPYYVEGLTLISLILFIGLYEHDGLLIIKGLLQMLLQMTCLLLTYKYLSRYYSLSQEVIYGSFLLSIFVGICESWLLVFAERGMGQSLIIQRFLSLPLVGLRISWIFPALLGSLYGYNNRRLMENGFLK